MNRLCGSVSSVVPPLPARLAFRVPGTKTTSRLVSQAFVELTFPLAAHFHRVLPVAGIGERLGRTHLRRAVKDPDLREKLTPAYALGCKRPTFSNDYLTAFKRSHRRPTTATSSRCWADGATRSSSSRPAPAPTATTSMPVVMWTSRTFALGDYCFSNGAAGPVRNQEAQRSAPA